ncbi:MAG: hypothetical protein HY332_22025 [Chloroflexi bacterium]|nr:hypothetical protein [Chloroflexota bacterium]
MPRRTFLEAPRWTPLLRNGEAAAQRGDRVRLRQVARVHRGVVTGANDFFILTPEQAHEHGVAEWCRPAITRGEEVLESNGIVRAGPGRRLLLDLPRDIDRRAHPRLDAYLRKGGIAEAGKVPITQRYIASRRRPWWYLGTLPAPPIVVSYMARQAPVFALNPDRLAVVNIAHGLYPTKPLTEDQLAALVEYLNRVRDSFRGSGRTYHGGLEKFEPGALEALLLPSDGPWAEEPAPDSYGG